MKISEAKRIVRLLAWRSLIAQRSNRGVSIRAYCVAIARARRRIFLVETCRDTSLQEK